MTETDNEPALPTWLIEAGDQFTDTYIPLTRMPGVPGPIKVSAQGLLAAAYVAGWEGARSKYAPGVPSGAVVFTREQWEAMREAIWKAEGWRQTPLPEPTRVDREQEPSADIALASHEDALQSDDGDAVAQHVVADAPGVA